MAGGYSSTTLMQCEVGRGVGGEKAGRLGVGDGNNLNPSEGGLPAHWSSDYHLVTSYQYSGTLALF